jgi:type VI secretion system protein ImpL
VLVYIVTAFVLLTYLVAAWLIGSVLHLNSPDIWILRLGLALIGVAGAAAFLWYYDKFIKVKPADDSPTPTGDNPPQELDKILRHAMTSSRLSGSNLRNTPAVLIVGDSDAAKTTTIVQSGLDPELLAGQIYQDKGILPTNPINVWYSRKVLFVEMGGKFQANPADWRRLLQRLGSGKISILKNAQAPRAAIVCFPAEILLEAGSETVNMRMRAIRQRLEDIAQTLGISFPVYVLFTKADRIPFFAEFTRSMTNEEAKQALGATLPLSSTPMSMDARTSRLNAVYNNLVMSLSDKRPDFLAREHDSQKLPRVYQFPREMRRLQPLVVQFLADLCKPSELRAAPFLRGFYFSGVRAVVVNEIASRQETPDREVAFRSESEATRMFRPGQAATSPAIPPPQVVGSRKVPQWTFLDRVFNDVLLQDHLALGASVSSVKTSTVRKTAFAVASALCLLISLAWVISYFGNRALETEVSRASRELSTVDSRATGADFTNALTRLDSLREAVSTLSHYRSAGPPLHLRWGLYIGNDLYPAARRLYFNRFEQLLFASTQKASADFLTGLPPAPGPADDYDAAYNALKAYLITTSNHEKSTLEFLPPQLMRFWKSTRSADPSTSDSDLAFKQFKFYAEELVENNPFSSEPNTSVRDRARRYLTLFPISEKVYRSMLAEAGRNSSILFNRDYPGSEAVITNAQEVPGAFSKPGWNFINQAIRDGRRFSEREPWVLGEEGNSRVDSAGLQQELSAKYRTDFIHQWQLFLQSGKILPYTSMKDAARKLNIFVSPQAPLLAMLCVASQNTDVDDPGVKAVFQPVQSVVPPGCMRNQYSGPTNTSYQEALVALRARVEQIGDNTSGPNDPLMGQVSEAAAQAKIAAGQLAVKARLDSGLQKLIEDPITYVERFRNPSASGLCGKFADLMSKYPFRSDAGSKASIDDVNTLFRPESGEIWKLVASLSNVLSRQGNRFAQSGNVAINPSFIQFLNNAAAFTSAVYPDNSPQPKLNYRLRSTRREGMNDVSLSIDGQVLSGMSAEPKDFTWSGKPDSEVLVTINGKSQPFRGPWAPFEFFRSADQSTLSGTTYAYRWIQKQGQPPRPLELANGQPFIVEFNVEGPGAPIFQGLAGLRCVSEIAAAPK